MSVEPNLSPVADEELLARFIFFSKYIRKNSTVKPDAFVPHPHKTLSVIRHIDLTEQELWIIGEEISSKREKSLKGRADIFAQETRNQNLDVVPTAEPRNHANIIGWSDEKAAQKMKALELSLRASFVLK